MERSLPDPRHAFKNELTLIKRQIRQIRTRQGWPGKVQQTPLSMLSGARRTGYSDLGYSTAAILRLDPGAWTLIAAGHLHHRERHQRLRLGPGDGGRPAHYGVG